MPFVLVDVPVLTAEVVTAAEPAPVRLVLTGATAGQSVVIRGTAGGASWPVAGGVFVSTGDQVVLVDNRGPLNTPIVYEALVDGVTYVSSEVTVASSDDMLLQSLDGRSAVRFVLMSNGLPQEPVVRSAAFDVPGRARPPVRFIQGGDGGGSLVVRTDAANSALLGSLVKSGRPLVFRTDGRVRDFAPVDILLVTDAPNYLWDEVVGSEMGTQRVWSLTYLLVDDPEPGIVLGAFTWDDHDAVWSMSTWDEWDTYFAGSTWDDFDRVDWGELL